MPAARLMFGTRGMASLAILHIFVNAASKMDMSDGKVGTTMIEVMPLMHLPSVSELVFSLSAVAVAAA